MKLPNKELLRPDEVATFFDVSLRTVYLWIDHGHLRSEIVNGLLRIYRASVIDCKFNI